MHKIYVLFLSLMILNGCLSEGGSEIAEEINARFEVEKRVFDVGETIVFNNKSTGFTSVYWDFGDGNYSGKISPSHVYKIPGDYQPRLTITGNNQNRTYKYKITVTGDPMVETDLEESGIDEGMAPESVIKDDEIISPVSEEDTAVTISEKPVPIAAGKIDQLLGTLANVGADRSQKDKISAELYTYCAKGSDTAVGGMETGTLDQLVIKLRIESTRYVRVNITTDLVLDSSGKIERIDIIEYTRKDI